MSTENDEDDYMSAAFIQGINEIKPKTKEKPVQKKLKVIEKEKRDEGLSQEIGFQNKGFQLLQKMGYKPGVGMGKQGQGLKVPIPINVRCGRSGLGREKELERCQLERWKNVQKLNNQSTQDFRSRKKNEMIERQVKKDLLQSRKVCEQLDTAKDIAVPFEKWFWPLEVKRKHESDSEGEEEEEEEEEEEIEAAEQLQILTSYLRDKYFYCIWCGTSFEDSEDLESGCPGSDFSAHN